MAVGTTIQRNDTDSLQSKVDFLRRPESYGDTERVEPMETHMSWVFLTEKHAYKLKKPVSYEFLDFNSVETRRQFCMEEVSINKPLGGDTYLTVVPLTVSQGVLCLDGTGKVVDWLVKMKRLQNEHMLHNVILQKAVRYDWVQQAAEMLAEFYIQSPPASIDAKEFKHRIIQDIKKNSDELLRREFRLSSALVVGIAASLLHFVMEYRDLFDSRVAEGRIVDGHGDLRPEHICLAPKPVVIDRIEFDKNLRLIDVVEELSFLALECEALGSSSAGQLFLNVYKWKSKDKMPDKLIAFYKAKRAFLRAKLSISHLLERKYARNKEKWITSCDRYLQLCESYCDKFQHRMLSQ
jgi:aminoglycoside phosphotransferase family enzyme